jgi:lipopolysaccharide biosynthesis regulator YciM
MRGSQKGKWLAVAGYLVLGIVFMAVALPCLVARGWVTAEILARRPRRNSAEVSRGVFFAGLLCLISAGCWLALVVLN